jgi:hypothetical protein
MANQLTIPFLFFIGVLFVSSCNRGERILEAVSYRQFEDFVASTNYITDAERYGWSVVQIDVFKFMKVDSANWRKPDGLNPPASKDLPVTQVSYNDAIAYCKWSGKQLPEYEEYWTFVKRDKRPVISDNLLPISEVGQVSVLGNVWDITELDEHQSVRLAGGSLFCSPNTCHGTVRERELYVDRETGNIHIGFAVID